MVVVTAIYVGIAIFTFKAIKDQARIAYAQTKATRNQLGIMRRQAGTAADQLTEMQEQARTAAKQFTAQLSAMQGQVTAAENTAAAAKASADSIRVLERPWLLAEILKDNVWDVDWNPPPAPRPVPDGFVGVETLPDEGVTVEVEWAIQNAGRSPGFITDLWYDLNLLPAELPPDMPTDAGPINEMLVRVAAPHGVKRRLPIRPDQLAILRRGNACVVIYGIVKYRDVFGDRHETRYCFRWFLQRGADGRYSPLFVPIAESKKWTSNT